MKCTSLRHVHIIKLYVLCELCVPIIDMLYTLYNQVQHFIYKVIRMVGLYIC